MTHLVVEVDVVATGRITVAATADDAADPYGVELDLDPEAASQLAGALLAAVVATHRR